MQQTTIGIDGMRNQLSCLHVAYASSVRPVQLVVWSVFALVARVVFEPIIKYTSTGHCVLVGDVGDCDFNLGKTISEVMVRNHQV
jgi:hypothetical protein